MKVGLNNGFVMNITEFRYGTDVIFDGLDDILENIENLNEYSNIVYMEVDTSTFSNIKSFDVNFTNENISNIYIINDRKKILISGLDEIIYKFHAENVSFILLGNKGNRLTISSTDI